MDNFRSVINWKKLLLNCEKYIQYLQENIKIKTAKGEPIGDLEHELSVKTNYLNMLQDREKERQDGILRVTEQRIAELPDLLKQLRKWLRKNKSWKSEVKNPNRVQLYSFFEIIERDFTDNAFPDDEYANDAFLILKNESKKHFK